MPAAAAPPRGVQPELDALAVRLGVLEALLGLACPQQPATPTPPATGSGGLGSSPLLDLIRAIIHREVAVAESSAAQPESGESGLPQLEQKVEQLQTQLNDLKDQQRKMQGQLDKLPTAIEAAVMRALSKAKADTPDEDQARPDESSDS